MAPRVWLYWLYQQPWSNVLVMGVGRIMVSLRDCDNVGWRFKLQLRARSQLFINSFYNRNVRWLYRLAVCTTDDTKLMNNLPSKFWQRRGCYKYYYFCGNVHLSIFHPFFARFLFLRIEMWMRGLACPVSGSLWCIRWRRHHLQVGEPRGSELSHWLSWTAL